MVWDFEMKCVSTTVRALRASVQPMIGSTYNTRKICEVFESLRDIIIKRLFKVFWLILFAREYWICEVERSISIVR